MVFIADKICNYIIYIFLIHYCWRIEFRKSRICRIASCISCFLAGAIDIYQGESTLLVYALWCALAIILLFDDNIVHLSILTIALTWFMGMIDTFSVIVVQIILLGAANNRNELQLWQLSAYVISFAIEFSYYYFILRKNQVYLDDIKTVYKITILIMTLVFEMVVVNVFNLYYSNPSDYNWYLHFRFALCLIGTVYAIAATLKLAVKNYLFDLQNKELVTALEIQKNHYLYQKENSLGLRRFRHDLINHIGVIRELLDRKQYESANSYISKIWNVTESLSPRISTGDDYIDAIMNYYSYICEKEDIDFKVTGKISHSINIEMVDITSLLGNALQNAIEATRELEKRYINVEIIEKPQEVFISIYNTCTNIKIPKNHMLITHKQDRENHGLGLKNIVKIIEKYRGEYYISVEEAIDGNIFKLDISLPQNR